MGPQMLVQAMLSELRELVPMEAGRVLEELRSRVMGADSFTKQPEGIAGITVLVKAQPTLQTALLELLQMLPVDSCGPWAVQGWQGAITDPTAQQRFDALLEKWSKSKNGGLAAAAQGVLKTNQSKAVR